HQRTSAVKSPSLKIFSMLFPAVYGLSFYYDLALFRYFPEAREFHWQAHPQLRPAILWDGWIVTSPLIRGALALPVPRRWSEHLWHGWVWLGPTIVTVVLLIYERRWFM